MATFPISPPASSKYTGCCYNAQPWLIYILGRFGSNFTTPTKPRTFGNGEESPSVVVGGVRDTLFTHIRSHRYRMYILIMKLHITQFDGSPTSTLSATTTGTASSQGDTPQPSPHNTFASAISARPALSGVESPRRFYVRVDASLLTCFDAADKELYDLWAPRR